MCPNIADAWFSYSATSPRIVSLRLARGTSIKFRTQASLLQGYGVQTISLVLLVRIILSLGIVQSSFDLTTSNLY